MRHRPGIDIAVEDLLLVAGLEPQADLEKPVQNSLRAKRQKNKIRKKADKQNTALKLLPTPLCHTQMGGIDVGVPREK